MNDPEKTGAYQPDSSDSPAIDSAVAPPAHIGRYRVEKVLGKGGFGLVYLAHDGQLQRLVAIKVPHRKLLDRPEAAEAYLKEARTVANLDHPNIVPVYDVGSTEDCPFFIVSKYIDGADLATRLRQSRLSIREAVELVATVAEALHFAHKQGLVHRDIKPGNILLDKSGKPFVADFGLALREQDAGTGPRYAGTPAYMSPEQARGEGHRVDGRSDIFSLGAVFYELLVGHRPFRAESKSELLAQVTRAEPRPPRQYDENIAKELERICLKALSKRASDRYTTAKDMADDLWAFVSSSPQAALPAGKSSTSLLSAQGRLAPPTASSDERAIIVRSTFLFADFKGFTERVRILEKTAGHHAAAEMKRQVAFYIEEAFRQLEGVIQLDEYKLIDTAGDGFFFHFQSAQQAFRFAEALHRLTIAHNTQVTDEIAEHWFRTGAATGEVAWDGGKPVGHVVNVGSRLRSASSGGDLVIDRATYDDLAPVAQQQFGPKEIVRDKHDKTYEVYRTAFGRRISQLDMPIPDQSPQVAVSTPVLTSTPASDSEPIRIVPKGLRSFDAHDADFFLELLPGPRDREGLPDSIRFWKTRIEEMDADNTFMVGLIYGPSGCGKSSLVKAGLLPRLSANAIPVYVEATAGETEARLLNGLRKRCPSLPAHLALKETLAALRRGQGVPGSKKVVIVLDQFEQWLHARRDETNTELVHALRQCDGGRVQCIVMVRDDFWLSASRFLRELEIRLLEGQNSALVDLFDLDHARKVLAAFGRAFGKLPENPGEMSKDQKEFLNQAVQGLAQEGKVISVRLALFAEMMKGKAWTPASLKAVGGTEGVGVTFLEETFSATTAPPEHRYHQNAARAVLKSLLPESGTDIKGHMRSHDELLEASGYAKRPKEFDGLIAILDGELRLITPTDPEGAEDPLARRPSEGSDAPSLARRVNGSPRYYQLTHDYLVPSLRDWLTRKQKETRRGRAELLLADRAGVWNARPEKRQLPSLRQWLSIRWLTAKKNWTPPQRKMMRKAGRYHAVRGTLLVVFLAVATITGLETRNATYAAGLVHSLLNSDIAKVPGIVSEIDKYRDWTDPLLREKNSRAENNSPQKLRTSLALLPVDPDQREYLYKRLLEATPSEVPVIRDALAPHANELREDLWAVVERPEKGKESQRLRAAASLAKYDANSQKWDKSSAKVADALVSVNPDDRRLWSETFSSVKNQLGPRLSEIFRDRKPERTAERSLATLILADYAADQPETLAELIRDADDRQFAVLLPVIAKHQEKATELLRIEVAKTPPRDDPPADASVKDWKPVWSEARQEEFARKRAGAALALLRLGDAETVWPLLKGSTYPEARSRLIQRFVSTGVDSIIVLKRLEVETDSSIRQALILALGEYGEPEIPAELLRVWVPRLLEWYQTDPDAGVHSAIDWLLRHEKEGPNPRPLAWRQRAKLSEIDTAFAEKFRAAGVAAVAGQMTRVAIGPIVPEFAGAPSWTTWAVRPPRDRNWFVNSQRQTFDVIDSREPFLMGSPVSEESREADESLHWRRIGRTYALQTKAVTVADFQRFLKANPEIFHGYTEQYSPEPDGPIITVTWYVAAQYCRWLSEQEGFPEEQMVYPNIADIEKCKPEKDGAALVLPKDHLQRTGYRLPTEAEWEYACRSGTLTSRAYGSSLELLPRYAWYLQNAQNRSWPVGQKRPNERGFFDLHGNTWTWCQESKWNYKLGSRNAPTVNQEDKLSITDKRTRVLRGGSFLNLPSHARSASRYSLEPGNRYYYNGFRLARTVTP